MMGRTARISGTRAEKMRVTSVIILDCVALRHGSPVTGNQRKFQLTQRPMSFRHRLERITEPWFDQCADAKRPYDTTGRALTILDHSGIGERGTTRRLTAYEVDIAAALVNCRRTCHGSYKQVTSHAG